jgi:hypothetical protein
LRFDGKLFAFGGKVCETRFYYFSVHFNIFNLLIFNYLIFNFVLNNCSAETVKLFETQKSCCSGDNISKNYYPPRLHFAIFKKMATFAKKIIYKIILVLK